MTTTLALAILLALSAGGAIWFLTALFNWSPLDGTDYEDGDY